MKKSNFALIGLGPVGEFNHLPILLNHRKINLVGICDKDKSKLNIIKKKYNLKSYTNFKKMIKDNKIDAVVLSSSLVSLFSISKYILQKKINLFVEKPMCISFNQAKELQMLSIINKVNYMVGYMKIYDPCITKLKNLIIKKNLMKNIVKVEYFSFGGRAFKEKFIGNQKKFNITSQVNNKIKKKKNYLKFINTHSHGIRTINFLFGKLNLQHSIIKKNYFDIKFTKKFPISFYAGYKFSKKWNEKIIIYLKKYHLCLDFASNNIRSKKSVLYKLYKNKKIFYKKSNKYSFNSQIDEMLIKVTKNKKTINDSTNTYKLFQTFEEIFTNEKLFSNRW